MSEYQRFARSFRWRRLAFLLFSIILINQLIMWLFEKQAVVKNLQTQRSLLENLMELKMLVEQLEAREELATALKQSLLGSIKHGGGQPAYPTISNGVCLGEDRTSRTCRFKNLCFEARSKKFIIIKSSTSMFVNLPEGDDRNETKLLDLTAVADHNGFFWDYEEVRGEFFGRLGEKLRIRHFGKSQFSLEEWRQFGKDGPRLTIVDGPTLLSKRFFPLNIMHIFHDDWLGYYNLAQIWPSISLDPYDEYNVPIVEFMYDATHEKPRGMAEKASLLKKPFANIVFMDQYAPNPEHDIPYSWFSGNFKKLEQVMDLDKDEELEHDNYVCFSDAVVGNSKGNVWYQYGFTKPQGPVENHAASGYKLRDAARFIFKRLDLPTWDMRTQQLAIKFAAESARQDGLKGKDSSWINDTGFEIGIFSRTRNRMILNEENLRDRLESAFNLPVRFIRMEEHSISEIVALMQKTPIAFGMHGCLLAMAMFMPPGSVLVEGFPYAVPAENYTPYKTLSELPGMFIEYRAWENLDENASIAYPDRAKGLGGISHLAADLQELIKQTRWVPSHVCCDNPYWLYRIFQDTRVDVEAVVSLIKSAVYKSEERMSNWKII